MKTCPVCETSYDARVDFCFRDGEFLVLAPAASMQGAGSSADLPEDEFDRPLPATELPVTAPRTPAPSATDLPQPRHISSAADLPEPAFLRRETVEETAPFPTALAQQARAPIPDDQTLPMPLGGAGGAGGGISAPPTSATPGPASIPAFGPDSAPPAPDSGPVFVRTAEHAFAPEPEPEPELSAWATSDPPPRMDEHESGGGPPWAVIALAAFLLIGVGGFFAWSASQPDSGQALADAGSLPALPAQAVQPQEQAVQPTVERIPEPVVDPEPALADLDPVQTEPEPGVTALSVVPIADPAPTPARDPEPVVASSQPAITTRAQPREVSKPAATPKNGTIKIKSDPEGAVLFIDGKRLGTSPQSVDTNQGRHKVRAEADGYKSVEIMVSLNGGLANANLTLQRDVKTQQVMLYGPAGAKSVRVAGQTINALPVSISLPLGRHVFTVTQVDGSTFQVSQSIVDGAQTNVMLLPPE